jgi:nucleoside-diphosphate-sugar epimerase
MRVTVVGASDVGEAFRLALHADVGGPFNLAAEPVLDGDELGRILGARAVPVPPGALRAVVDITWRLHLQPTPPGWVDMGLGVPIMDCSRARAELGWKPRRSAADALLELLAGMREGAGAATPALASDTGRPLRSRELETRVGGRES